MRNRLLETEKDAVRDFCCNSARSWLVSNASSRNYLDQPRGYRLLPLRRPPLNSESRLARRAACVTKSLFVTKFRDADFGLARAKASDEGIVDQDVVLWHTFGLVHAPASEQMPVMNHENVKIAIVPECFFNENPALYYT